MTRRFSDKNVTELTAHLASGQGPEALKLSPPKPRKPRNNEESVMQRSLIRWWQLNCRHFGVREILLFSVPNGGNGDARRGSIMKAEGQRKGAPDLFLAVPRILAGWYVNEDKSVIGHTGLFLELKRREGVVAPEQETFHELLAAQGYRVAVCRSLQECIDNITSYLNA